MSAFILGSFFKKYNEEEEKEHERRIDLKVEMVRKYVAERKKAAEERPGGPSYFQDGGPFSPYRNEFMFKIFTSKPAMTFFGGTVCAEAATAL
ncbi:MAG: hypothetical protein JSS82_03525 [Bacteroidetes bacterium]|nr:hypothetical protein [Bacteroidota bacterium]